MTHYHRPGSLNRKSLCHSSGAQKSKSKVSLGKTVPACHQLLVVPAVPGPLASGSMSPTSASISSRPCLWCPSLCPFPCSYEDTSGGKHWVRPAPPQDDLVLTSLTRSTMTLFPNISHIWRFQKVMESQDRLLRCVGIKCHPW